MIQGLEIEHEENGRTTYKPTFRKVGPASQYNATNPPDRHAWRVEGLEGYWQSRTPLTPGVWYKLALSTKEKGGNAAPGSLYQDVGLAREARPDEINPQQAAGTASAGGQYQPQRPTRPDGEEVFRTKEELRWTEAYHMATRLNNNWEVQLNPGITLKTFLTEWADWFYIQLAEGQPHGYEGDAPETEPQDPEALTSLPFDRVGGDE